MKKNIFYIAIIIIVITGFVMYSGKIEPYLIEKFEFDSNQEKDFEISNEINLPMEKVRSLNPIISKDYQSKQLSNLIYQSLFRFNSDLVLEKELVSSYSFDEKKGNLILNLKNNIKFSNGKILTAQDVKGSIDGYINCSYKNQTAYSDNISNIKWVDVNREDPFQVIIRLRNKEELILNKLTFPIVPKEEIFEGRRLKGNLEKIIPSGSGKYKVQDYNEISSLILEGNTYYKGVIPDNTLIFTVLPDEKTAIPLLEVNSLNLGIMKSLTRDVLLSDLPLKNQEFTSNKARIIGFNCSRGITSSKEFRKGIENILDINDINKNIFYGKLKICKGMYPEEYFDANKKVAENSSDANKGKTLILNALESNDYIGIRKDLEILVNHEDIYSLKVGKKLVKVLSNEGVQCNLKEAVDKNEFKNKIDLGLYDIFVGSVKMSENFDLKPLLYSLYNNPAKYKNELLDNELDKFNNTVDIKDKKIQGDKIEKILKNEVPYVNLGYETYGYFINSSMLGNENTYWFNNIYKDCEKWRVKIKKNTE